MKRYIIVVDLHMCMYVFVRACMYTCMCSGILGCIKRTVAIILKMILLFYSAPKTHLEYCVQFGATQYKRDKNIWRESNKAPWR